MKRMDSLGWRLPLMVGALIFAALYGRFSPSPSPPPATPIVKANTSLSISVGPPGAQIIVDGKALDGVGPVQLPPARKIIMLRHDGSSYVVVPHVAERVTVELVHTR